MSSPSPASTFISRILHRHGDYRNFEPSEDGPISQQPDPFLVLLPLLIVLSTFLFLLLVFLVCILIIRRRRGISLQDHVGPVDMSREELIEGEGGFEGVESRWLESVSENVRREYNRAKDFQLQYPPNSQPTDITLSQFLSIQEKGVSAWSFEPDYETVDSLLVHARTEITFLPDPASSSCVQSNLPLPKLNEVYYWEVKLFDLPETTTVSVGLATKPYPAFRLPGLSRYSVGYHSNGDKSHNYPFTTQPFGPTLKEGDVLGVGYRPRTGTVFFTRNGRKMEDAFIGLSRWNLFPTIGADGPCSVHVNLGQAGFVFIEANVKKWGLAPSVGTLAPPPAYGSERGSILLDVGGRSRAGQTNNGQLLSPNSRSHRSRRPRNNGNSPLRGTYLSAPSPLTPPPPITPIDEEEEGANHSAGPSGLARFWGSRIPQGYQRIGGQPDSPGHDSDETESPSGLSSPDSTRPSSPISAQQHQPLLRDGQRREGHNAAASAGMRNPFTSAPYRPPRSLSHLANSFVAPSHSNNSVSSTSPTTTPPAGPAAGLSVQIHPPPDSPMSPMLNPPTPGQRDIHLQSLPSRTRTQRPSNLVPTAEEEENSSPQDSDNPDVDSSTRLQSAPLTRLSRSGSTSRNGRPESPSQASAISVTEPPAYSPLDAFRYADGVQIDLPAEVIAAALEGNAIPAEAIGTQSPRGAGGSRRSRRTRS